MKQIGFVDKWESQYTCLCYTQRPSSQISCVAVRSVRLRRSPYAFAEVGLLTAHNSPDLMSPWARTSGPLPPSRRTLDGALGPRQRAGDGYLHASKLSAILDHTRSLYLSTAASVLHCYYCI